MYKVHLKNNDKSSSFKQQSINSTSYKASSSILVSNGSNICYTWWLLMFSFKQTTIITHSNDEEVLM